MVMKGLSWIKPEKLNHYLMLISMIYALIFLATIYYNGWINTIGFIFISTIFLALVAMLLMLKIKVLINTSRAIDFKQQEALAFLHSKLDLKIPVFTRGWAVSPDLLALVIKHISTHEPKQIVELGAGASTLYIAQFITDHDLPTHLISIEESVEFHNQIEKDLTFIASNNTQIIHCPITTKNWYDLTNASFPTINLLIIDGPGIDGPLVRYPALPQLTQYLADQAFIIIDDYNRKDEKRIVEQWLEEFPELKVVEEVATEKGTIILQKI